MKIAENHFYQIEFVDHLVVTVPVMALAEMSASDENAVCAIDKTVQEKHGVYSARAHNPDHPDVGRILKPRHPSRISRRIATPVAEEA
jgi:hypothetical protein